MRNCASCKKNCEFNETSTYTSFPSSILFLLERYSSPKKNTSPVHYPEFFSVNGNNYILSSIVVCWFTFFVNCCFINLIAPPRF